MSEGNRKTADSIGISGFLFAKSGVEVTGLEPATAWSQTRNATNCATPRCLKSGCKGTKYL